MNIHIGDCIVTLVKSPEHRGLPSVMEAFEGQAVKSTLFVKTKEIKITLPGESHDKKFLRALKEKNPAILEEEEQKKSRISMGILLVAVFNNGNWQWRTKYKENEIVTYRQGMQLVNKPMFHNRELGAKTIEHENTLAGKLREAGLI